MAEPTEETYLDESEITEGGGEPSNRYRLIGLVSGVVVVFCCLAGLVAIWLGREPAARAVSAIMASITPTSTETQLPTETATFTLQIPTDTQAPPTDTPTPTLSPTPNRLPALDVMAIVTGPPVMKDEFVDNSNGWVVLGEAGDFTIQQGFMRLSSKQAGRPGGVYCTTNCGPFKDHYYYQAEVVEERAGNAGVGLLFALDSTSVRGYNLSIRPSTGEYFLGKLVAGNLTPLIDWTPSPAILPNPQPNLIGASYQEGIITVYINGQRQQSFKDTNPLKEGRVGFTVDPDASPLLGSHVSVFTLFPTTPTPPGMAPAASPTFPPTNTQPVAGFPTPTNPIPGASPIPGVSPAPPQPPAQPVQPTATRPAFTPTPTRAGACPSFVPAGVWVLQIYKQSPGRSTGTIDGSMVRLEQGVNTFYLQLDRTHVIEAGGKTKAYEIYNTCVIKTLTIR